jgi:hypothetical protein
VTLRPRLECGERQKIENSIRWDFRAQGGGEAKRDEAKLRGVMRICA